MWLKNYETISATVRDSSPITKVLFKAEAIARTGADYQLAMDQIDLDTRLAIYRSGDRFIDQAATYNY